MQISTNMSKPVAQQLMGVHKVSAFHPFIGKHGEIKVHRSNACANAKKMTN